MIKNGGMRGMWILILIVVLILISIVYIFTPFSCLKSDFHKVVLTQISNTGGLTGVFTLEEIESLPVPVKRYFQTCGYIGNLKMEYAKIDYKDVDFLLSVDKPYSKIDYTQYTFVKEPKRLAFIDTNMSGIPFQGLDSYVDGAGGMKGVIAKIFTLFNETGPEMNISCLINTLSECLIVPTIALQDYIVWESIDDTHAKATISYYGISASGIFTFAENNDTIVFTTNDRWNIDGNGVKEQIPWSIILSNYKEDNGIMLPTSFKGVWHYSNGDSVYFNGKRPTIEYH